MLTFFISNAKICRYGKTATSCIIIIFPRSHQYHWNRIRRVIVNNLVAHVPDTYWVWPWDQFLILSPKFMSRIGLYLSWLVIKSVHYQSPLIEIFPANWYSSYCLLLFVFSLQFEFQFGVALKTWFVNCGGSGSWLLTPDASKLEPKWKSVHLRSFRFWFCLQTLKFLGIYEI